MSLSSSIVQVIHNSSHRLILLYLETTCVSWWQEGHPVIENLPKKFWTKMISIKVRSAHFPLKKIVASNKILKVHISLFTTRRTILIIVSSSLIYFIKDDEDYWWFRSVIDYFSMAIWQKHGICVLSFYRSRITTKCVLLSMTYVGHSKNHWVSNGTQIFCTTKKVFPRIRDQVYNKTQSV